MNQYLPAAYLERVWRLAAGIIPVSALGGAPPLPGVRLALERVPEPYLYSRHGGDRPLRRRHRPACRRAQRRRPLRDHLRHARAHSPVAVRLYDTERRYVPRRFRLPVPDQATVVAADRRPSGPHGRRSRAGRSARALPGGDGARRLAPPPSAAGWPAPPAALRAGRGSRPPTTTTRFLLAWAHGDDRREFLLVLTSSEAGLFTPGSALAHVTLTISARPVPVTIDSPAESQADPLWVLEVETLPAPGSPDTGVGRTRAARGLQPVGHVHPQLRQGARPARARRSSFPSWLSRQGVTCLNT